MPTERIAAGALDKRATFEYPAKTQDPVYGTELVTWTTLGTFWGELRDVLPSDSESVTQGLAVARNQSRWRMRWVAGVTSEMRVTVHGTTDVVYEIVGGPAEIGRKDGLELMLERYSS